MQYLSKFVTNIVNPIIYFLFAVALMYFLYGIIVFIMNADDEEARKTGKKHIFWGMVGLFIMVSVYGILGIVLGTVGADIPTGLQGSV
ncbi:MAG: hypothetical protein WCJ74_02210 [bacterium]